MNIMILDVTSSDDKSALKQNKKHKMLKKKD